MRFLLPSIKFSASNNQIVEHSSHNETPTTKQSSVVVGSWEEQPNIWSTVTKNAFVGDLWILESAC